MIKLALLTTDNREQQNRQDLDTPFFGTAPAALLQGFAQMSDEIEVHVISCTKRPMAAPAKLADNIWFHQPLVPHLGWGRSLFLGCARSVRHTLRDIRPDLVHGQGAERDCAMSAVLSGYPNILTLHGIMGRIAEFTHARFPQYYWLADKLEKFVVARTQGLVAISTHTQRRFASLAKQTWLVPNACDAEFFDVNANGSGNYALCVANVHAWKGQVELIKALDTLPYEARPNVLFVGAAGNGSYAEEFQYLISSRPWCEYRGNTAPTELRALLALAKFLILPSFEDNCPMVILEAMASGVPVAASRIGGVPDLISHEKDGLLFDPTHPNEMRSCIERLVREPETRARFGHQGRITALERFHPKVIAAAHLKIYREVLGR